MRGKLDSGRQLCFLDRLDDCTGNHVRIRIRCWSAIFQPTLPAVCDGSDWNSNRSTTIGYTVAELVDLLRFMQTGQALIVIRTVDINVVLDAWFERLANGIVSFLAAAGSQQRVGEVGMHATAVPIAGDWLAVPVDRHFILLGNSFQ